MHQIVPKWHCQHEKPSHFALWWPLQKCPSITSRDQSHLTFASLCAVFTGSCPSRYVQYLILATSEARAAREDTFVPTCEKWRINPRNINLSHSWSKVNVRIIRNLNFWMWLSSSFDKFLTKTLLILLSRGHSITMWTTFCLFFTPSPPPSRGHFANPLPMSTWTFMTPPFPLAHILLETK